MSVKIKPAAEILRGLGLDKNGRVQKRIDRDVLTFAQPYLPPGTAGVISGDGQILFTADRAAKNKQGDAPNGVRQDCSGATVPDGASGMKSVKQGGGMRGAYWYERMKADRLDDIIRGAREEAGLK